MSTTQEPGLSVDIRLTPTAADQVRSFMDQEDLPETGGLRVSVLPGGCSGFTYGLNIEDRSLDDDIVMELDGIKVFVDAFSAQYLNGTTIDYVSTVQGSGFSFNNPNAAGGCGCGSSFAV
jgi:iron-sulfur cluster assembly accessory protein